MSNMAETTIRAKLRRWGNTYGIAVSPSEVKRLHAKEGQEVTVTIQTELVPNDFSDIAIFHLGRHASRDHEDLAGAGAAEDLEENRRRWHR